MIKSRHTILKTLSDGGYIQIGANSGYWLVYDDGSRKRVASPTVTGLRMDALIQRIDDRTQANGAMWGLS